MKKNKYTILFLALLLISCQKKTEIFPKGDVVGFVKLIDETGKEIEDRSGINVEFETTSHTTTTNALGRYEFKNVEAGTYNLIFEKEGFGNRKRYSCQFVGGPKPALLQKQTLYQQPSTQITKVNVSQNNSSRIQVEGELTETESYDLHLFLGTNPDVSPEENDYSISYSFCCIPTTTFGIPISRREVPYHTGQIIYVALYLKNTAESYGNFNPETGTYNYSSFKMACPVFQFKLQ
ncbi:MAG: carboxypeptidase-like regulatory domain-containing protein [Marinifilaceae bacterium]